MEIKIKTRMAPPKKFKPGFSAGTITKKAFLKYLDKNLGNRIVFSNWLTEYSGMPGDLPTTTFFAHGIKTINFKRKNQKR